MGLAMGKRFYGVLGILSLAVAAVPITAVGWMDAASAQEVAQARTRRAVEVPPTIPEAFEDAFFSNSGSFFDSHGILPSLGLIFGIPHYPENAITRDGHRVHRLYRDVLQQQVASDPTIRTPDLPNPFSGSVLTTPLVIREEPIPPPLPFPPVRQPNVVEPPPGVAPPPTERAPVPALW